MCRRCQWTSVTVRMRLWLPRWPCLQGTLPVAVVPPWGGSNLSDLTCLNMFQLGSCNLHLSDAFCILNKKYEMTWTNDLSEANKNGLHRHKKPPQLQSVDPIERCHQVFGHPPESPPPREPRSCHLDVVPPPSPGDKNCNIAPDTSPVFPQTSRHFFRVCFCDVHLGTGFFHPRLYENLGPFCELNTNMLRPWHHFLRQVPKWQDKGNSHFGQSFF